MTIADHVAEHLAIENAELRERVASLESDNVVRDELIVASLDALRVLTLKHERQVQENERLRSELRALREELLLRAAVDDDRNEAA